MQAITMFRTFDMKVHESKKDAEKHLDVMYTDRVYHIAAKMQSIDKYQEMKKFIDEHLDYFCALKKIKEDMILLQDTDEDNS